MLPHHHQIVAPHNNPTTTWNHLHHPCPHHHQIRDVPSSRRVSSNTALEVSANWVIRFHPKGFNFLLASQVPLQWINNNNNSERETETHPTEREKERMREKLCFLFPENYGKNKIKERKIWKPFVSQNCVGLERRERETMCVWERGRREKRAVTVWPWD